MRCQGQRGTDPRISAALFGVLLSVALAGCQSRQPLPPPLLVPSSAGIHILAVLPQLDSGDSLASLPPWALERQEKFFSTGFPLWQEEFFSTAQIDAQRISSPGGTGFSYRYQVRQGWMAH